MNEVNGIVTRMRELSVQAASSGTMDTTERGYLDQEFQLLESELNRIVEVTEYSGVKLINGDKVQALISRLASATAQMTESRSRSALSTEPLLDLMTKT